jgi:hypothetical protein
MSSPPLPLPKNFNASPCTPPNIFSVSANNLCGLHSNLREPLHPSTRSYKRRLAENTISGLLMKLDYTGLKLGLAQQQCEILKNVLDTKDDELEVMTEELLTLKRERREIWENCRDLHQENKKLKEKLKN